VSSDLRAEFERIYDKNHGLLTPAVVVDEWRNPSHPFHGRLEWDNRVAGEAWRREQAHKLITSVRVAYRPDDKPKDTIRAFQALRLEEGVVYHPSEKIAQDPFLTKLLMADMERDWRQLKQRYDSFAEFWQMINRDSAA
jgi:hypothetical protein